MRRPQQFSILATLLPLVGACISTPHAPLRRGLHSPAGAQTLSAILGQRSFEADEIEPLEKQPMIALNYQLVPKGAWLGLDFSLSYTQDDTTRSVPQLGSVNLEAMVWEASAGLHKQFRPGNLPLSFYVGAGVAILLADAEITDDLDEELFEDEDTSFAPYARVGVLWRINDQGGEVGIDLRHVGGGEVQIGNLTAETNYTQIGINLRHSS